jgi:hypothetical protein
MADLLLIVRIPVLGPNVVTVVAQGFVGVLGNGRPTPDAVAADGVRDSCEELRNLACRPHLLRERKDGSIDILSGRLCQRRRLEDDGEVQ